MRDYRKLVVWQLAKKLALYCYEMTSAFPGEERFGLTSQIRRSAISIASNIAEGAGRDSDRELLRSLRICSGSLNELETQAEIARDLGYLDLNAKKSFDDQSKDLGIRIRNLMVKLEIDLKDGNSAVREERAEYTATFREVDLYEIDLSDQELSAIAQRSPSNRRATHD